ncbi:MAG TPA: hypothetical protein VNG13_11975 [Mycobacteriales bacterium]|nr:hypothetical protein [Mycobacteriales bacterium]
MTDDASDKPAAAAGLPPPRAGEPEPDGGVDWLEIARQRAPTDALSWDDDGPEPPDPDTVQMVLRALRERTSMEADAAIASLTPLQRPAARGRSGRRGAVVAGLAAAVLSVGGVAAAVTAGPGSLLYPLHEVLTGHHRVTPPRKTSPAPVPPGASTGSPAGPAPTVRATPDAGSPSRHRSAPTRMPTPSGQRSTRRPPSVTPPVPSPAGAGHKPAHPGPDRTPPRGG